MLGGSCGTSGRAASFFGLDAGDETVEKSREIARASSRMLISSP